METVRDLQKGIEGQKEIESCRDVQKDREGQKEKKIERCIELSKRQKERR
jgi:hypothetical protein